jgi:general secretion pathway protein F
MTAFRYRAARPDGELLDGTVEAGSHAAALLLVEARGLFPVAVEAASARRRGGIPAAELATTLAGLAALLEAGLPVDRALGALEETASPRLGPLLAAAGVRVREGAALSSALEAAQAVPPIVLGYLKAGERGGRLAASVERAAAELERTAETQARIRAALTYPAFLLLAGTVSVIAIVGFVVPRFAALLGGEGRALPASTRLLIGASGIVSHAGGPAAFLALILIVASVRM